MKHRIIKRKNPVAWLLRAVDSSPLVVVFAPMGYGKTTLAREFAERAKQKTCLFTVPADSSDVDRLWEALWRAMEAQGIKDAPKLRRMGFPSAPLQIRQAIEILQDAAPAYFILDDYHNCSSPDLDAFLEAAIRNGVGGCRFLLFSRTRPAMELDELQLKGLAAVYDQRLLAFSAGEAKEFFLLNGVVDETAAEYAWKYSEGWAAALWLCLRNSQRSGSPLPSGDVESLMDRVVFSAYSPEDRLFLMQLSLLDSFTASEAAAVTLDSGAARRLGRIRDKNALIDRDIVGRRYRFHSLFRDFLQKQLKHAALNHAELYRRTAECHAARKEYMPAYRFLIKAGRDKDSVRFLDLLLEQNTETMSDSNWEEIHSAMQTIPWRLRLRQPLGYLAYIWLCDNLQCDFIEALLDEAETRVHAAKSIPAGIKKRLAGEMEFMRGHLAMNDLACVSPHYKKARAFLAGPSFLPCDRLSWTYCSPSLTSFLVRKPGEYQRVVALATDMWEDFFVLTGGVGAALDIVSTAEYAFERGEFEETGRLLADLDEWADERERPTLFLVTLFLRCRLLMARGMGREALGMLLDSAPRIEKTDMLEHIMCHDLALGYVLGCMGRTDRVPRWLADGNIFGPPYCTRQIQSFIVTVYGKTLLARGDYGGLARMLEGASGNLGFMENLFGRIHRKVFEAILVRRRDGLDGAMSCMREAVELSRPDGIVMTLVEYGDAILPLLRRLRRTVRGDAHLEDIFARCKRAVRFSQESRSYKKSLLTVRERKIMRLVVRGKTTPSIALSLGMAESTVKSALSLVYGKLGAGGRVEAAKRFEDIYGRRGGDGARSER